MFRSRQDTGQVITIAILVILLMFISIVSLINFVQVPLEEAETEMDHFDEVQSDFSELDSAISKASYQGEYNQVGLQLGTRYEGGFILDSPFPKLHSLEPTGEVQVETMEEEYQLVGDDLEIHTNINNTEPSRENISFTTEFETSKITYNIEYSQISGFEKNIEPNVYYNTVGLSDISRRDPGIIEGDHIKITLLSGALRDTSTRETMVEVNPVSTSSNPVTVENLEEIHVPTNIPDNNIWNEIEEEQNVENIRSNQNKIIIELDKNEDYNLEISEVSLYGEGTIFTPLEPEVQYVSITPDKIDYQTNTSKNVTAKVIAFDEYHNRVSGVKGNFQPDLQGAGTWNPRETVTNHNGITQSTWTLEEGQVGENGTHDINWGS